jgi:phosphohistidine phosphatase
MKELFLVRHAKSSWKDETLSDFERPLNKRGKRDAPFMGKFIKQQGVKPDLFISSPASRTLSTAKIFAEETGYPFGHLLVEPKLYMASRKDIFELIKEIDDLYNSVMVFSHNPGLTDFAVYLGANIDNIPTCGIAAFDVNAESWKMIENNCNLKFFEYPKKYFKSE